MPSWLTSSSSAELQTKLSSAFIEPILLLASACRERDQKKENQKWQNQDHVSQACGRQRISTSVIRGRRYAPKLKLVHCSVELVRDYCSLHPTLNPSCGSGSVPSCVQLFEVGKSCSHVLLMLSLYVFLSVCLCSPVFVSLMLPASLNTEGEI